MSLAQVSRWLSDQLRPLRFGPPVTHVYDPLCYAREPHERYLELFGQGRREVLLLGMNPGPYGMAQTGVPFGEVRAVRDWLGVTGAVAHPSSEHPRRPVLGLACSRSEVSGARVWGFARARFGTPAAFFERFFVANYCPLCFMEGSGKNRTPDALPAVEREPLFRLCDEALRRVVALLQPRLVVGVGSFAEGRAREALAGSGVAVGRVLHPSPASPAANRGWDEAAARELRALGVAVPDAAGPA